MKKDLLRMHKKHYELLLKEQDEKNFVRLHDDFLISYTYDAVSLEGNNKNPFSEVRRIIKLGRIVDKSNKSELEILNHVAAFNKVLALSKKKRDLLEEELKDIHEILLANIMIGGVYRNLNVQIIGGAHQPPDNIKVYDKMKELFIDLTNSNLDDFHKGIFLHANLAKIYPFLDGNGRTARLVLNYYLIKAGYIPISIPVDLRDEYFKVLEIFKVNKDLIPLTEFVEELLLARYEELNRKLDI